MKLIRRIPRSVVSITGVLALGATMLACATDQEHRAHAAAQYKAVQLKKPIEASMKVVDAESAMQAGNAAYIVPEFDPNVRLAKLDFRPEGTDEWDIDWPGPPRRAVQWSDVKRYTPIIELESPAPIDFTLMFWVKEDRSWWFDADLGFFWADMRAGNKSPLPGDIHAPSASGDGKAPAGAPYEITGAFYLAVTKKGKIKGSEGKEDDGHANVYLETFDVVGVDPDSGGGLNFDPGDHKQSPRHEIERD